MVLSAIFSPFGWRKLGTGSETVYGDNVFLYVYCLLFCLC